MGEDLTSQSTILVMSGSFVLSNENYVSCSIIEGQTLLSIVQYRRNSFIVDLRGWSRSVT